jgi:hypothetical protein
MRYDIQIAQSIEISRSFDDRSDDLRRLIESGERKESESLLKELQRKFPVPTMDIIQKEERGTLTDQLILRSHDRMYITQAVRNIEKTGRSLSIDEKEQLRRIAFHSCGWSSTQAGHENDAWMRFLRYAYPDLDGLQSILDSLIWPDEISRYPIGYEPWSPWLFLLATKTKYYVYNFPYMAMLEAGSTLNEVIDGLKKERWMQSPTWEEIPSMTMEECYDYFPVYENAKHTSYPHPLEREIKEFTLKSSNPFSI